MFQRPTTNQYGVFKLNNFENSRNEEINVSYVGALFGLIGEQSYIKSNCWK